MYTLLGGVRSEADGARFSYTNKEQIFEGSCKDIDTVRNVDVVARVICYVLRMYGNV